MAPKCTKPEMFGEDSKLTLAHKMKSSKVYFDMPRYQLATLLKRRRRLFQIQSLLRSGLRKSFWQIQSREAERKKRFLQILLAMKMAALIAWSNMDRIWEKYKYSMNCWCT